MWSRERLWVSREGRVCLDVLELIEEFGRKGLEEGGPGEVVVKP